jgi:branched-chain amino acid transport system permease protein
MDISLLRSRKLWVPGLLLLALAGLAVLPLYGSLYVSILVTSVIMYTIITVSWVLFSGPSGYLSLASAAFFGVGIYASALLLPNTGAVLPMPVVILIAGAVSFVMAVLVGFLTLRLKGIYFAIFTFGLVELVKQLLLWWEHSLTGTRGRFVMLVDNEVIFWYMLAIFVVLMLTVYFIRRSRFGLALQSIGENEDAAQHSGVNVTMLKVVTFGISAVFMGMAGAVIATKWTYVDPYIAFNPLFSFLPVLMAIFGGMGQIYGPVIGSVIFAYLQETLQTEFPYVYMLIFGLVLIAAILYLPDGIVGLIPRLVQRWRKGGSAEQHADT